MCFFLRFTLLRKCGIVGWEKFLFFLITLIYSKFIFYLKFILHPNTDVLIPGASDNRHAIARYAQRCHSIFMTLQNTCRTVGNHYVPTYYKLDKKKKENKLVPLWLFLRVSQTCTKLSSVPQKMNRPLKESPVDVKPGFPLGGLNEAICWSARISHNRAVLSSEAVTKLLPDGWYFEKIFFITIIILIF